MNLSVLKILFLTKSCVAANDTQCKGKKPKQACLRTPATCWAYSKDNMTAGASLNPWGLTLSSDMRASVMWTHRLRATWEINKRSVNGSEALVKQKAVWPPLPWPPSRLSYQKPSTDLSGSLIFTKNHSSSTWPGLPYTHILIYLPPYTLGQKHGAS